MVVRSELPEVLVQALRHKTLIRVVLLVVRIELDQHFFNWVLPPSWYNNMLHERLVLPYNWKLSRSNKMDHFARSKPRLFVPFRLDNTEIGQPSSGAAEAMEITATKLVFAGHSSSTSTRSETSRLQDLLPQTVGSVSADDEWTSEKHRMNRWQRVENFSATKRRAE